MSQLKKVLKICSKGHSYYKSFDCPTCPFCEEERKPKDSFMSSLAAPARRALENKEILTLEELSNTVKRKYCDFMEWVRQHCQNFRHC